MSIAAIVFAILTAICIMMFLGVILASISGSMSGDPAIIFVLYISLIAGIIMCGCATYWEATNTW